MKICECCGQPEGRCLHCGSVHIRRTLDGCEKCAPPEGEVSLARQDDALTINHKINNETIPEQTTKPFPLDAGGNSRYILFEGILPNDDVKLFLMNVICSREFQSEVWKLPIGDKDMKIKIITEEVGNEQY